MKRLSTRQKLERIPNVQNLYRHTNGNYYGIKKVGGKRKEHSLETKDRITAERKLKQWLGELEMVDRSAARTTLEGLLDKLVAANAGKALKTIKTDAAIIKQIKAEWPGGVKIRVSDIRPSHLNEWLAKQELRLRHTSYNRYAGLLKQLFEIAVADRMIAASPFDGIKTPWKKPQAVIRRVPTQGQFETIVREIRGQKLNSDAEETADFVEFLGLAGLGQAEAATVQWKDIDFQKSRIAIRRHKTQAAFYFPIYPHLKSLLDRRRAKVSSTEDSSDRVFRIKDAKKALAAACERLKFHKFSQRNIRQVLIRRLWQSGVDYKLISKWQGHQDGGKLILDTYTEVFGENDASYEAQQIQKIK